MGFSCSEVRVTGRGEKSEELRPNAVYAHDPALIPEQARGNMAACLHHDLKGEGVLSSASLDFFRAFTAEWPQFLHAGKWQVRETVIVLLNLARMKAQLQT